MGSLAEEPESPSDLVLVDAALVRFAQRYPRQAQVVELRFFGGLTAEETAETMSAMGQETSPRTVERDWRFSKAWLQNELGSV
jgi:RNA polymerase sigma-70 factor, ECF subfamily